MRASVLINNFNNARYLRDCLDSVLHADGAAAEVVVYDDGSTDGSQEILRSYGARIVLLCGEHNGRRPAPLNQGRAIEAAFARATGEVIFLLDGDDTFMPHKLAHYLATFATDPTPVMVQINSTNPQLIRRILCEKVSTGRWGSRSWFMDRASQGL